MPKILLYGFLYEKNSFSSSSTRNKGCLSSIDSIVPRKQYGKGNCPPNFFLHFPQLFVSAYQKYLSLSLCFKQEPLFHHFHVE